MYVLFFFIFSGKKMNAQTTPNYHSEHLEVVAELGEYQAIGVSVSPGNRLFVSFPRRGGKYRYGLVEIVNGRQLPYPNEAWNIADAGEKSFYSVQDLYVDTEDFLWVLDSKPAPAGSISGDSGTAGEGLFKLMKINLQTNEVERIYHFEDLDKKKSALNDVRVDIQRRLAYLSDPGLAAIVVLDLQSGKTRAVLSGSDVTSATPGLAISYEGKEMRNREGKPFQSNVNGIALTRDNRYFYFKPINHYALYRIATEHLADTRLSDADLLEKVENMGNTVITHGLEADTKGNIFLTSSVDYSVKYMSPDGVLHTLVQDKRLLWPDSFGVGSDGYLYFSCAQLQREATWNEGRNLIEYPFRIYRVKLP